MPDILHRVGANARPDRVFKALTTIDGLRGSWVSEQGTLGFHHARSAGSAKIRHVVVACA
jgi:hypothetical protein